MIPAASPFLWASWSQVYPRHISAGFAGFRAQISLGQDLNSGGSKGQGRDTNEGGEGMCEPQACLSKGSPPKSHFVSRILHRHNLKQLCQQPTAPVPPVSHWCRAGPRTGRCWATRKNWQMIKSGYSRAAGEARGCQGAGTDWEWAQSSCLTPDPPGHWGREPSPCESQPPEGPSSSG